MFVAVYNGQSSIRNIKLSELKNGHFDSRDV